MYALGIDIGTTKIAACIVDAVTGEVCPMGSAATPNCSSRYAGEHLQDAAAILHIVLEIIERILAENEICAIGISGQMHGIVYLNVRGAMVSPLYTWQDMRGEEPSDNGIPYTTLLGVSAGYGHATHAYNREHGLVPSDAVGYVTIADAICAALCQNSDPILHASNAASMGCFDIERSCFTAVLCNTLRESYPYAVTGGYHLAGTFRGIPVSVGIGDNQAAFLGSGCGMGEALVNIGTGSQISVLSERPASGPVETRPGFDGNYLLVGAALCGGRAYAMLHSFFCDVVEMATGVRPDNLYDAMAAYQQNASDASLCFDNAFCGSRHDPGRRGSICGISSENFTPEQFCIGLLEGIVGELAERYTEMGVAITSLVGAGNALRKNPLLCTLCEKRFGTSLYLPPYMEEAAVGAALFALLSAGILPDRTSALQLVRKNNAHTQS